MVLIERVCPAVNAGFTFTDIFKDTDDVKYLPFTFLRVKNDSDAVISVKIGQDNYGIVQPGEAVKIYNVAGMSYSILNNSVIAIPSGSVKIQATTDGEVVDADTEAKANSLLATIKAALDDGNLTAAESAALLTSMEATDTDNKTLLEAIATATADGNITAVEAKNIQAVIQGLNGDIKSNTGWAENTPFEYSVPVGEDATNLITDGVVTNADYVDVAIKSLPKVYGKYPTVYVGRSIIDFPLVGFAANYSLPAIAYGYHPVSSLRAMAVSPYAGINIMPVNTGEGSSLTGWPADHRINATLSTVSNVYINSLAAGSCYVELDRNVVHFPGGHKYRVSLDMYPVAGLSCRARVFTTLSGVNSVVDLSPVGGGAWEALTADVTIPAGITASWIRMDMTATAAGQQFNWKKLTVTRLLDESEKPVLSVKGSKFS